MYNTLKLISVKELWYCIHTDPNYWTVCQPFAFITSKETTAVTSHIFHHLEIHDNCLNHSHIKSLGILWKYWQITTKSTFFCAQARCHLISGDNWGVKPSEAACNKPIVGLCGAFFSSSVRLRERSSSTILLRLRFQNERCNLNWLVLVKFGSIYFILSFQRYLFYTSDAIRTSCFLKCTCTMQVTNQWCNQKRTPGLKYMGACAR